MSTQRDERMSSSEQHYSMNTSSIQPASQPHSPSLTDPVCPYAKIVAANPLIAELIYVLISLRSKMSDWVLDDERISSNSKVRDVLLVEEDEDCCCCDCASSSSSPLFAVPGCDDDADEGGIDPRLPLFGIFSVNNFCVSLSFSS